MGFLIICVFMKNQTMLVILKSKYYAPKIICYNLKINNYEDLNFPQNISIRIY